MSQNTPTPSTPVRDRDAIQTLSRPVSPTPQPKTPINRKPTKRKRQPLPSSSHTMRLRDRSAKSKSTAGNPTAGNPSTTQDTADDVLPQLGLESAKLADGGAPMTPATPVKWLPETPGAAHGSDSYDAVSLLPLPGAELGPFFSNTARNDLAMPSTSTSLSVEPGSQPTNVVRPMFPSHAVDSSITPVISDPPDAKDTVKANEQNRRANRRNLVSQSQRSRVQPATLSNATVEVPQSSNNASHIPQQASSHGTSHVPQQASSHGTLHVPQQGPSNGTSHVPQEASSHCTLHVPQQGPSNGTSHVPQQASSHSTSHVPQQGLSHVPQQASSHDTSQVQHREALGASLHAASVPLPQDGSQKIASAPSDTQSFHVLPGLWDACYQVTPPTPDASIDPFNPSIDTLNLPYNVSSGVLGLPDAPMISYNDMSRLSAGPSRVTPAMGQSHSTFDPNLDDGWTLLRFRNDGQFEGTDVYRIDDDDIDGEDIADDDIDDGGIANDDTEDSDGTTAIGRISDANAAIIKAGYLEMKNAAKNTAKKTGLTVSQVFKKWSLSHRRKHVRLNHWNLYSKYFKDNQEQELQRLPYRVTGEVTQGVRRECYDAFKIAAGSKAMVILEHYHKLLITKQGMGQKTKDRKVQFTKSVAKLTELMDNLETLHGFSGVFALLGNIVNSDSGLAELYETKDADGFFEVRCRADKNEVLTHLKAHIYNNVSLELVKKNFPSTPLNLSSPSPVKTDPARSMRTSNRKDSTAATPAASGSSDQKQAIVGPQTPLAFCDMPTKHQALLAWVISALLNLLDQLQIPGIGSWKLFPWRTMGAIFPKYNIQGHNWPEGVPLPPIDLAVTIRAKVKVKNDAKAKSAKAKSKSKAQTSNKGKPAAKTAISKTRKANATAKPEDLSEDDYDVCVWDKDDEGDGDDSDSSDGGGSKVKEPRSVGNLPLNQLHLLGSALCDEYHPLHFVIYDEGGPEDIAKSIEPVMFGVPPLYTAQATRGRRLFANGHTDRLGLPRLKGPRDGGNADSKKKHLDNGSTDKTVLLSPNSARPPQECDGSDSSSRSDWEMMTVPIPTTPRQSATPPLLPERLDLSDTDSTVQPQVDSTGRGGHSHALTPSKPAKGKGRASDVGQSRSRSVAPNNNHGNVKRRLPSTTHESLPNKRPRTSSSSSGTLGQPAGNGAGSSHTDPDHPPNVPSHVQPRGPSHVQPGSPSHVQPGGPSHVQPGTPSNLPSHVQPGNPPNVPSYVQPSAPSNVPSHVQPGGPSHVQPGAPSNVQPDNPPSVPLYAQSGPPSNGQTSFPPNVGSELPHGQMNAPQGPANAPFEQWNFAHPWMYGHNGPYFGVGQNGFGYQGQNTVYGHFPQPYPPQFVQGNSWNPAQNFFPAVATAQQSQLPPATPAAVPRPHPQSSILPPTQDPGHEEGT